MRLRQLSMLCASIVLAGCATMTASRFQELANENDMHLSTLSVGMTQDEVRQQMGRRRVGGFYASLRNPDESEMWWGNDRSFVVDYYVTEVTTPRLHELQVVEAMETPVVFEQDRLVGWGWPFFHELVAKHSLTSQPHP